MVLAKHPSVGVVCSAFVLLPVLFFVSHRSCGHGSLVADKGVRAKTVAYQGRSEEPASGDGNRERGSSKLRAVDTIWMIESTFPGISSDTAPLVAFIPPPGATKFGPVHSPNAAPLVALSIISTSQPFPSSLSLPTSAWRRGPCLPSASAAMLAFHLCSGSIEVVLAFLPPPRRIS